MSNFFGDITKQRLQVLQMRDGFFTNSGIFLPCLQHYYFQSHNQTAGVSSPSCPPKSTRHLTAELQRPQYPQPAVGSSCCPQNPPAPCSKTTARHRAARPAPQLGCGGLQWPDRDLRLLWGFKFIFLFPAF